MKLVVVFGILCCWTVSAYQQPLPGNNRSQHPKHAQRPIVSAFTRARFLATAAAVATTTTATTQILHPPPSFAFDGGVGGLGKTKPQTGVVFAYPELAEVAIQELSIPGDVNAELLTPDEGTPVFLSFYAPWPMLKSQGIESRDLANAESSFVQVATIPDGYKEGDVLKKQFFIDSIFGQTGKYGAYGTPTDVKISKVPLGENEKRNSTLYQATFVTLTPAMRESDRKVYISTKVIGNGVFMLVTGTTLPRFKGQEKTLRKVADSFECVEAPKSSFRR